MREAQVEILLMYANGLVTSEQAERMIDALEDDRAEERDREDVRSDSGLAAAS